MIPRVLIDTADIPGGGGQLRLMQRGDEFAIMLGATELMHSRKSGSEAALATLACDRLQGRSRPRILIGGLGIGFTLRAALAALGKDAIVEVAELVPEVVAWVRGPLAHICGDSLADPRVRVIEMDVATVIEIAGRSAYDAILLDVDNGPEGLTRDSNDRLYSAAGLRAARTALRPGGIHAVWSSAPDPRFTQRLKAAGFDSDEQVVRGNGERRGGRHIIWISTSPQLGAMRGGQAHS